MTATLLRPAPVLPTMVNTPPHQHAMRPSSGRPARQPGGDSQRGGIPPGLTLDGATGHLLPPPHPQPKPPHSQPQTQSRPHAQPGAEAQPFPRPLPQSHSSLHPHQAGRLGVKGSQRPTVFHPRRNYSADMTDYRVQPLSSQSAHTLSDALTDRTGSKQSRRSAFRSEGTRSLGHIGMAPALPSCMEESSDSRGSRHQLHSGEFGVQDTEAGLPANLDDLLIDGMIKPRSWNPYNSVCGSDDSGVVTLPSSSSNRHSSLCASDDSGVVTVPPRRHSSSCLSDDSTDTPIPDGALEDFDNSGASEEFVAPLSPPPPRPPRAPRGVPGGQEQRMHTGPNCGVYRVQGARRRLGRTMSAGVAGPESRSLGRVSREICRRPSDSRISSSSSSAPVRRSEGCTRDLEKTEKMRNQGEQLIRDDHYAVDSIRPKCIELQRMCQQYKELMRRRREVLTRSSELHDRLDKANKWCTRGVDLLSNQPLEQCQGSQAQEALKELENFLALSRELKLSNPKEFRQLFESMMTSETRAQVHEVLKRMEDVQSMCAKRRESLQKLVGRHPAQTAPAKQTSPPGPPSTPGLPPRESSDNSDGASGRRGHHLDRAARMQLQHASSSGTSTTSHSSLCASDSLSSNDSHTQRSSVSSMSTSSLPDLDNIQAKRKHVMNELIDSEKMYVIELHQILRGYYYEFDNKAMRDLIPPELIGKRNILFGNLEQIYRFHNDVFLQELQNCREFPSRVGRCFVNRREEFQMYSIYCQNKPKSEALRMQVGDNNPFFKECQRRLDHKLPLGAYLLKPVQRITKYQLLLREMLRFVGEDHDLEETVQAALDTMLHVLHYLNDSMHQVSIVGFSENLADQGRLLIHGDFSVWTEHKKEKIRDIRFKAMHRHVFLYERSLLFCKKKEDVHNQDNSIYVFKNKLTLCRVGLTENIKGDKRKFELWSRGREEVYIIQAPNMEVKEQWVKEIKRVLMSQFDQLKVHHTARHKSVEDLTSQHKRNTSDPGEYNVDNWRPQPNNNTSTVPVGLEMSSPVESPSSGPADVAEDEGWSSGEFSNTDEESSQEQYIPKIEPSYRQHFVSLGDYYPVDSMELQLHEGDVVEVIRVGTNGWWFARHLSTTEEGWVPSTYLEPAPHHLSTSSSDSLNPGGHISHSQSRASFGSKYNLASPMEETTV